MKNKVIGINNNIVKGFAKPNHIKARDLKTNKNNFSRNV